MGKIRIGSRTLVYPMPTTLVGANVDGKPNFMAVAWCGIANGNPPMVSIAIRHERYTLKGIRQNTTFSVNIPSTDMVKETDYCGIVSGADTDKVKDCRFDVFYGKLDNAPLIEQCPVNLECQVVHTLDMDSHTCIIGRIEEVHISEDCLTDGEPDVSKVSPFAFITGKPSKYQALGDNVGTAFSIGKELKTE